MSSLTTLFGFWRTISPASNYAAVLRNVSFVERSIHTSASCQKKQAGRYKRSIKGDKPLTYEMANPPEVIAHLKSWNSWNTLQRNRFLQTVCHKTLMLYTDSDYLFSKTIKRRILTLHKRHGSTHPIHQSCHCTRPLYKTAKINTNLVGGLRASETAIEDIFIRRFMTGTWHALFVSEIIIKRQHNLVRIAGIINRNIPARKVYFLIGYSEELLGYWLQCPIKLELQTVDSKKDVIFKYV